VERLTLLISPYIYKKLLPTCFCFKASLHTTGLGKRNFHSPNKLPPEERLLSGPPRPINQLYKWIGANLEGCMTNMGPLVCYHFRITTNSSPQLLVTGFGRGIVPRSPSNTEDSDMILHHHPKNTNTLIAGNSMLC